MPESSDPTAPRTPKDKWRAEFEATRNWQPYKDFLVLGQDIDKKLRVTDHENELLQRWNLFPADVRRKEGMLLGRVPQATVGRRFQDADDDVARVAGEILQRLLNTDLESPDDDQTEAYRNALRDWLGPGLGQAWLSYQPGEPVKEADQEPMYRPDGSLLAEGVGGAVSHPDEKVETDYVHWKDFLWQARKTWGEIRWVARARRLTVDEFDARFPAHKVSKKSVPVESGKQKDEDKRNDPVARVCVWEIWDRAAKQQVFYVEGYDVLESRPPPLKLSGFYPCPKPMMAFLTTSSFVPVADYKLACDLYAEVDRLSSRILLLEDAIRVRGVYPAESTELQELLKEGGNRLIPVQNWPAFFEKGGLQAIVQYLPLEILVQALQVLTQERGNLIDAIYQITGSSDIMRGQATQAGATATEQRAKVRFGSIILQQAQDEFARFVSDAQRIKAEIIAAEFSPATILERCNCANTPDRDIAPEAVAFLKQDIAKWRIEVKPEAVNYQDFAALKEERTQLLEAIGAFMERMGAMAQQFGPQSLPFMLEMLKWLVAGMRGASVLEGVLDKAIKQAQMLAQQPQQQPPNPKVQELAIKGQQDMAKIQADLQADLTRTQAEVDADAQREANQMQFNVQEHAAKARISAALRPPEKPKTGGAPS